MIFLQIYRGEIGGKCGVCGDKFDGDRQNEMPDGKYAYDRVTAVFREGAVINVTMTITERAGMGDGGSFIFKLCDRRTSQTQVYILIKYERK